jgi:hypothetical protein
MAVRRRSDDRSPSSRGSSAYVRPSGQATVELGLVTLLLAEKMIKFARARTVEPGSKLCSSETQDWA